MRITLILAVALAATACDSEQQPPTGQRVPMILLPDATILPDAAPIPDVGPDALREDAAIEEDTGPPPDAAAFTQIPFAVETRVGDRHTVVGLENRITCEVLDQQGAPIPGLETRTEIHPDSGWDTTEIGVIGRIARDYRIICTAPRAGLRDPTPADWTVLPGGSTRVVTFISDDDINVGEETEVTCEAYDEEGNLTDDEAFQVHIEPPTAGVEVRGATHRFTAAGNFDVTCRLPGADSAPGVALTVRPGLPAAIALGIHPERPVYRVGSVVELLPIVTDSFENPLPEVPILYESEPVLEGFGAGRFRCAPEGEYTLAATVDAPTLNDIPLTASLDILVDRGGPGITCEHPDDGEFIHMPEGRAHTFQGTVADIRAVQSVHVDGRVAQLFEDGGFRSETAVEWGLNVHDIVATDGDDESSTFCSYYASEVYHPEDQALNDSLLLRLGQGAVDEGEPDRPIGSLADVLRRVINSRGLRDTVHSALLAQNPVVPNECRARVLGLCLFRLGVEYQDLQIGGRNTIDLSLVDGGLRARTSVRNLAITAQLRGTLGNRARISTEHITIDLTFGVGLRFDGNPDVWVQGLNEVSLGRLDSDFSGFLTGAILELVFWAFEGLIRRTATDAIRDYLEDNIDAVLSDLLSNVDIGELGAGFDVPSLTGGEPIPLTLTAGLSTLDFAAGRAMVGVKTKVDGPTRVAGRNPGVALPPGTGFQELPADRSVGAAVMLGVLNQVLHRLWRAGFFEAEAGGLVGEVAGDLPEGYEVFLRIPSPPVVTGVQDAATVRVFVGPLVAGVVAPPFFIEPFRVRLAAVLDATVSLQGERDLSFEGVRIVDLHLDLGADPPPLQARQTLEDTLRRVVQAIIDRALNDGLPVLPLPEFIIPDSLGQFDLPVGSGLGLRQPRLTGTEASWILDGNFGE